MKIYGKILREGKESFLFLRSGDKKANWIPYSQTRERNKLSHRGPKYIDSIEIEDEIADKLYPNRD